jgi:hypothetical protein
MLWAPFSKLRGNPTLQRRNGFDLPIWRTEPVAAEAISEYVDLNEWRVAGIQKAVASLDRGGAGALGSSKWLLYPGTRQWDECMK